MKCFGIGWSLWGVLATPSSCVFLHCTMYFVTYFRQNFQGPGGITVKKTNLALIIGIYDEPMTAGQCNMIVERLGDYLIDQSF